MRRGLKAGSASTDPVGVADIPGIHSTEEALHLLEIRLKQLKHEYEQYFRGTRPRAPVLLRGEVQKIVNIYTNVSIGNTALRFKFNNLCARFFVFRRQWDAVLRQIEDGTYQPHRFKARIRERGAGSAPPAREAGASAGASAPGGELFENYLAARRSCGEGVKGLTPERLGRVLEEKRAAIQRRYGCQDVRFRVVVENGRTKLKASPVR